jgi:hypothetical protein
MTGNRFIGAPLAGAIIGIYARYADAQQARYDLILAGFSSDEVEIASEEELRSEYGLSCELPEHGYALLLHAHDADAFERAAQLIDAQRPMLPAGFAPPQPRPSRTPP